jgi:hypothetical protein
MTDNFPDTLLFLNRLRRQGIQAGAQAFENPYGEQQPPICGKQLHQKLYCHRKVHQVAQFDFIMYSAIIHLKGESHECKCN